MHTAIGRRRLAVAAISLGTAVSFGCFRGDSLLDPSGTTGYRPPTTHVAAITLAPTSVSGPAGSHVQISASPQGPSGTPVAADAVAWVSSDPKAASVSGTGMVTLVHRGNTTITAIADGVTASVSAAVQASPAASIVLTPDSTLIETSETVQLIATAYDGTGAVDSGATVNWSSSNTGVASVSGGGLVTAIAVGTAVVTASSGSANATAIIRVTSAAVVVATVSVTPSTSSLYPGRTEHLTATLRDASGNTVSGVAISWSTSNAGVVSISGSGVATANAVGSATITASAGGKSGTATVNVTAPVVASVSVSPSSGTLGIGQVEQFTATPLDASGNPLSATISWNSSDAGVASVSQSGQVTGNAVGTAVITATAGGVSGSANLTVQSGPPGGYHEPSGMSPQINTGAITSIAAFGFTVWSPSTTSSTGEWSGNLSVVPGGTGLRITYPPNVVAGNSPVRFGRGVPSAGTGRYYQRMKVRFSSNWTNANNPGIKLCEPRTQQTGNGQGASENDVITASGFVGPTQNSVGLFLQGPNGQSRVVAPQPSTNPQAILTGGNWHLVEALFGPESSLGAGNGTYQAWVDGVQVANYNNVLWLAPGNNVGWPYLMFDPTYGGAKSSPPYTMYWDVDELYVSTR